MLLFILFLLVEIGHLIRLMFNGQLEKNYQVVIAAGAPPLPIPNREVKPVCADGTAMQCGRVGGRSFYESLEEKSSRLFFVLGDGCWMVSVGC